MTPPRRTTYRRYTLFLDISILVLTSVILIVAVSVTLSEMDRHYLDLRRADAAKANLFLERHLDEARRNLATFVALSDQERSAAVTNLFSAFSDIYRLDPHLRAARVYKAAPGSKVFTGFSFSAGRLADYLKTVDNRALFSEFMPGYEDNAPSVYVALRRGNDLYLGRLDLAYIQKFLEEFSRFSGSPLLLVSPQGIVMLSGTPELQIPTVDLKTWSGTPSVNRALLVGKGRWIPMILETNAIGARIVILTPTELPDYQRNALLAFFSAFMAGLILLTVIRSRQLNRQIMQPISSFAGKMRDLETGQQPSEDDDAGYLFEELADIRTRFRAMSEAIAHREQSLAEATAQARELAKEAQAASLAKSEFLANMSHEIRTPMNGVLGLAQLLEKEPLSPDQLSMVRRIRSSGRTLLGIINDILDFSKIEAGELQIENRPFVLPALLNHVDSLLGATAHGKGLDLLIEAPAGVTGGLVGDDLRLEQILINLIGNAVKFTEQGGVRGKVIPVELTETAVRLRFEVHDTGIGIAPEALAKLFTPFSQADGSITRRFGGTGLGLSISRRLVELMGGTICAESEEGKGSVFWFELSFERTTAVATESGPEPHNTASTGPRLSGLRVLVADDSDINREVVKRALTQEGAEPVLAGDGKQALDLLRTEPHGFHAVVMDIQMPVMDGLTATRLLRSGLDLADLPVIAFTAGVLPEERQKALDVGVNDFLAKPVDLEEMVAVLRRWTGDRQIVPLPLAGGGEDNGIPAIPGIETAQVSDNFGNDREFFLEMLEMFFSRFGETAEQLRVDLERGELKAAARRLHTLRGTAGNLGALELMKSAGELEQAIVAGSTDTDFLLEQISGQLAALREAAAPWLTEPEETPVATADAPCDLPSYNSFLKSRR